MGFCFLYLVRNQGNQVNKRTIRRISRRVWKKIDWFLAFGLMLVYSFGFFVASSVILFLAPFSLIETIRQAIPITRGIQVWFMSFHWLELPILAVYAWYLQYVFRKAIWPFTTMYLKV